MTNEVPANVTKNMAAEILKNIQQLYPNSPVNHSNVEIGILRFLVDNHLKIVER